MSKDTKPMKTFGHMNGLAFKLQLLLGNNT